MGVPHCRLPCLSAAAASEPQPQGSLFPQGASHPTPKAYPTCQEVGSPAGIPLIRPETLSNWRFWASVGPAFPLPAPSSTGSSPHCPAPPQDQRQQLPAGRAGASRSLPPNLYDLGESFSLNYPKGPQDLRFPPPPTQRDTARSEGHSAALPSFLLTSLLPSTPSPRHSSPLPLGISTPPQEKRKESWSPAPCHPLRR